MKARPGRILLESTSSLDTSLTTGIQRVVRSVIREASAPARRMGVECIPVVFRKDRFYDASAAWRRQIRNRQQGVQPALHRFARAIDWLSPAAAQLYRSALVRTRKALYPKALARALTNARWQREAEPVSFRSTDVLLILDQTWGVPMWSAIERARARGCCIGAVVYDLIPIDHPQFFESAFVKRFTEELKIILRHSDFFLPISESVAGRLKAHMVAMQPMDQDRRGRVVPFRLGAATAEVATGGSVRGRLRRLLEDRAEEVPYLCVGTLEPRKNHQYLLDAFELVWSRSPQAGLCIVGRIGWKCQDTLKRIRRHPRFGKSLFLFTDLSDRELFSCYRWAKALLSCSVDEGFDLPVVEGLHHGLRVLASDIPIHREIGGDACDYFDLTRPESLAERVLDMQRRGVWSPGDKSEKSRTTTWRESCEDLLAKAMDMAAMAGAKQAPARQGMDLEGAGNRAAAA